MTHTADTRIANETIIGPFSVWPKKPRFAALRPRNVLYASTLGGAGVIAHCIAPMMA